MANLKTARLAASLMTCALGAASAHAGSLECERNNSDTASAPWSQTKFQEVITGSLYLQIDNDGSSSNVPTCISTDDMQRGYYDRDNWHLIDRNMFFGFTGGSGAYRVELRGVNFSGTLRRKFASKVKVGRGASTSTGFTVAQVFSDTERKPILRIEMIASRKQDGTTYTNNFWAIYRKGVGDGESIYLPLGTAATSFTALDVIYNDSGKVSVTYGTKTVSFSDNFSFWNQSRKSVYMKAGCYLQQAGDCGVTYSSLRFDG
jgi:Alginate lyase